MTKQQYMVSKTYNPLDVVYHYYRSHEKLNHKPLSPNELMIHLQTRGYSIPEIIRMVMEEYDRKFEMVALFDQRGNLIKYL